MILTGANGFAGTTTAVEGVLLVAALAHHLGKRRPNRRHRSDLHRATLAGDGHVRRLADRVGRRQAHRRPAPPTLPRAYPHSTLGSYTITATARDTSGNRGTAEVAVKVSMTTPVFAINAGRPVSAGTPVNWQTHVFVDDGGTNLNDGAYEFQFPAAGLNGPVTY